MYFTRIISSNVRQVCVIRNFWTKMKIDHGQYDIVEPGKVSAKKQVPDHIPKPSYHITGKPTEFIETPEIKDEEQISKMRTSCKLAAKVLRQVENFIQVGVTTDEVDTFAHNLIISNNAYPSPLNYRHFPKSVCTSVNNVACHGIPDDRRLQDGDIINVDITVYYQGHHGDCSKTFLVGNVDAAGRELVHTTELCLNEAIAICKPGRRFCEIGAFVEQRARKLGFTVIPAFVGHGIGYYFHGPPDICHTVNYVPGVMQPGMTFTIEPVLSYGGADVVVLEDEWTAVTFDSARTAQFEHTVLITDGGVEILTSAPD